MRRSLLAVIVLAAGLAACSGGGGTETVLLGAVEVDAGNVVLGSGCWERLDARAELIGCLLYTSPSPRDRTRSRMPSSA